MNMIELLKKWGTKLQIPERMMTLVTSVWERNLTKKISAEALGTMSFADLVTFMGSNQMIPREGAEKFMMAAHALGVDVNKTILPVRATKAKPVAADNGARDGNVENIANQRLRKHIKREDETGDADALGLARQRNSAARTQAALTAEDPAPDTPVPTRQLRHDSIEGEEGDGATASAGLSPRAAYLARQRKERIVRRDVPTAETEEGEGAQSELPGRRYSPGVGEGALARAQARAGNDPRVRDTQAAKERPSGLMGFVEGIGRRFLPDGWPGIVYVAVPLLIVFALVALIGGILLAGAFGDRSTTESGTSYDSGGGTPPPNTAWVSPGSVSLPNWFVRPLDLSGWVNNPPWFLIMWLVVAVGVMLFLLALDRAADQQYTDLKLVTQGMILLVLGFIGAEAWTYGSQLLGRNPDVWPNVILGFGLALNMSQQFSASRSGQIDWSPMAVAGLFIPGLALASWLAHSLPWAIFGWVMMLVGFGLEILETQRLGRGRAAITVGAVMAVSFYVALVFTLVIFDGVKTIPPPAVIDTMGEKALQISVRAVIYAGPFIAGLLASGVALLIGQMAAMPMVAPTSQPRVGPDSQLVGERTARYDSVQVGIMIVYLTAIPILTAVALLAG